MSVCMYGPYKDRAQVLLTHPDKLAQAESGSINASDIDDTKFKKVQRAYEVLSHVPTRMVYDSQDDFDESIPSDSQSFSTLEEFCAVYGPVFVRNAKLSLSARSRSHRSCIDEKRWCVSGEAAVPQLGDASTSDEDITKFYDFWLNFRSWRVFLGEDEHDPETAECREERFSQPATIFTVRFFLMW